MALIDKAAMALAQMQGAGDWDGLAPEAQEQFRSGVYAVLSALRDPDAVMAEAGAEIIRNVGPAETGAAHRSDAVNTWRFMVDALLGERRHLSRSST